MNDTSGNGTIEDGVIHYLLYGYQEELQQNSRGIQRNRHLEHRFLLPKRSGCKSKPRSRSSSSSDESDDDDDELALAKNVYNAHAPHRRRNIRTTDLLNDPDRYLVKPRKLHAYLESRKPNLVLFKKHTVPNTDYPGYSKVEYTVKVIIEISSYQKSRGVCRKHIQKTVEQCVESCLAAFSCNQDLMYGLVVVVDGFVLIKVEKQNLGGQAEYKISETDLIMWDNADSLHAMLYTLNSVL